MAVLVPNVNGQQSTRVTFSSLGPCGQVGIGPQFQASGLTYLYYWVTHPMVMYVLDIASAVQWSSGPFGWIACAPSSGNWVRYTLGLGDEPLPLTGRIDLNLPANSYVVVFVAPSSETNPTATVSLG